jgi:hypothetical protein
MPFGHELRQVEKKIQQEQSFKGYQKKYVKVDATITELGQLIPRKIYYDELHVYEIDKVLEVRKAVSLKVGGVGLMYRVRICNKETRIFFDDYLFKFFIENKMK